MNKYIITLIGAGQLGSRYLQGLAKSKSKLDIWVMDPSKDSLVRANARWMEAKGQEDGHSCHFVDSIMQFPENVDLAIVATTADVRADVVELLAAHSRVRFWVLEKVLAQSLLDLDRMTQATHNAEGVWVNLPFRTMDWHKKLGSKFFDGRVVGIAVHGGDWGLACNALHYLDLVSFWTGRSLVTVNSDKLDNHWHHSKRLGFYDVYGELKANFAGGLDVFLDSKNTNTPHIIEVMTTDGDWIVNEVEGRAIGPGGNVILGRVELQSDMSALLVETILELKDCELPTLADAVELHRPFLKSLFSHWNQTNICYDSKLPIT
jgi:hypothetical protein